MTANGIVEPSDAKPGAVLNEADFIKQELFYDLIEKQFGKCTIKKFVVQKNSGGGENYVSVMLRVKIDIEKADGAIETANYIVKMMPHNDPQAQFKKTLRVFEKEVEMYEHILPKIEQAFREKGVDVHFGPKYFKTIYDPKLLIMADLKAQKYENINRQQGMDMQHVKLVLAKLAQFHAASACIFEKFGPYSEQLTAELFSGEAVAGFRAIQGMLWKSICKNMRRWPSCQEYVARMESMQGYVTDLYLKSLSKSSDEFNVLLHGDLWANNIMFRHCNKGEATDVIFVDLQLSRYGSPIQDLIYFIFSSTEKSIKIKEFDYFLRYYHRELIKNLKLLEYPKSLPSLTDLHITAVKRCFLGIMVSVGVMAAALLDPTENANIDNFLGESEAGDKFKQFTYTNPRLIEACESIFPFLENKGAFDL